MPESRKPRLLIVDDQTQVRSMLEEYFTEAEFDVTTAEDVPAALAALPAGFDVVLSDIRMPGQSGIDFLQQGRAQRPSLGVFLMTGYQQFETLLDAKCYGAQAYFQKPLDLEAMEQRIREYLATIDYGAPEAAQAAVTPSSGDA